jgi:hypothetical protein
MSPSLPVSTLPCTTWEVPSEMSFPDPSGTRGCLSSSMLDSPTLPSLWKFTLAHTPPSSLTPPEPPSERVSLRLTELFRGSSVVSHHIPPFLVQADNQLPVSVSVYPLSSVLCSCETLISVLPSPGRTPRRTTRRTGRGSRMPVSGSDSGARLRGLQGFGLPLYVFSFDST